MKDPVIRKREAVRLVADVAALGNRQVAALEAQRDELLAALKGVVRVADRKTDEFDAARAAIARAEGRHVGEPQRDEQRDELLALVREASEIMSITYAGNFPAGIEGFLVRAACAIAKS